jgi:hypothetical protein
MWPYTWGRALRTLAFPIDIHYSRGVTETVVRGQEHLVCLRTPLIVAGTHHGFPDMTLVRHGLEQSPARDLARRLVPAASSVGLTAGKLRIHGLGLAPWYMVLAFGLFPLSQSRYQDASLRRLVRIAQEGNVILIFPQGTHVDPEDERRGAPVARFRTGVAHLAEALDAPVLPFGLAGTEVILPAREEDFKGIVIGGVPFSYTRGPLAIVFGAPLRLAPGETPEAFAARLQDVCFGLTRTAEVELARRQALV